jgi:hypothetical protein
VLSVQVVVPQFSLRETFFLKLMECIDALLATFYEPLQEETVRAITCTNCLESALLEAGANKRPEHTCTFFAEVRLSTFQRLPPCSSHDRK